MKFKVLPKKDFDVEKFFGPFPPLCYPILFAGDRWSCITHVAVARKLLAGEAVVAIATIAPKGEGGSGNLAIVGIYVEKGFRGRGIGTWLLQKTVEYMVEQGLVPVRMDALNPKILSIVKKLPSNISSKINVVDQTLGGIWNSIMER